VEDINEREARAEDRLTAALKNRDLMAESGDPVEMRKANQEVLAAQNLLDLLRQNAAQPQPAALDVGDIETIDINAPPKDMPAPPPTLEIPVHENIQDVRAARIAEAEDRLSAALKQRDALIESDDVVAQRRAGQDVRAAQTALDALRVADAEPGPQEAAPVETVDFGAPKRNEVEAAYVARGADEEKQKAAEFDKAIQQRAEQEVAQAKTDSEFQDRLAKYNADNNPVNPAMQVALMRAYLAQPKNKGKTADDVQASPPLTEPSAATLADFNDQDLETVEVPLSKLSLSKDVPQFKSNADAKGIVEPLAGTFMRTGVSPIVVWERKNGKFEVISGRHRYDLARRSGEKTIPSHVVREADGFTKGQAQLADAELNIRDEQGSVSDYARYFRDSGITEDAAQSRGLLARGKGRAGFSLATRATPALFHSYERGKLTDAQAAAIADAAPTDERLQTLGIKLAQSGSTIEVTVGTMQAVQAIGTANPELSQQGDIFGFDDSAMREAERIGKEAAARKAEIREQINAVAGAAKRGTRGLPTRSCAPSC
jgi:hypothetical protein